MLWFLDLCCTYRMILCDGFVINVVSTLTVLTFLCFPGGILWKNVGNVPHQLSC